MKPIRVHGKLESSLLDSPELADLRGRIVDLVVFDAGTSGNGAPDLSVLDEIAGKGVMDENAVADLRRASIL